MKSQSGFTLIEVLVALTLLTVGIVGTAAVLMMQAGGLSGASTAGLAAINWSNSISTATTLAQAQVEAIKNSPFPPAFPPILGPNEGYGAISGYTNFRRVTTVATDAALPAATRKVTVEVFFRPVTQTGLGPESSVRLATIIAQRP